jgi:tripartite ATP-independent transporter DctM subunit
MVTFLLIVILLFALAGAPIFACFTAIAALCATTLPSNVPQSLHEAFGGMLFNVQALATGDQATTLSTIPLFTFTGYIMAESKTAERLVTAAKAVVGWIPGGLALVTILTCALFTTFTGASGVTIVAIGSLLLPALIKEGYKERYALGLVAGTGSVGLLFPPALPLIVYGIVYGVSSQAAAASSGDTIQLVDFRVEKFMVAGIVPGLLLLGVLFLHALYHAIKDKVPTTPFEPMKALRASFVALPEIIIPVLVITCMAKGWLLIPEVAACTALYVLLVEALLYRDISLRNLPKIARESMGLVGAIFMVIVGATALTGFFISARVPDRLYEWMSASIEHRWAFLLVLNVLLLLVGCVMDIFSAIVVVVPLIAPAAAHYGIDPYHLGVIFLLNLEVGYLHPPVGLNLIIAGYHFRKPMAETVWATLPFLGMMIVVLLMVTYVPGIVVVHSSPKKMDTSGQVENTVKVDAGPVTSIALDDGGVLSSADCEKLKDSELDYVECTSKFTLYAKCNSLTEELDKLDCQTAALEGNDWFADQDAGAADDAPDGGAAAPFDAGAFDVAPAH